MSASMPGAAPTHFRSHWAPAGWIAGRWQSGVCLDVAADGHFSRISTGVGVAPPHACVLPGPVLPGLVNAHSHAFQRAFAGLAERNAGGTDDFWSWRERMYATAARITPAQLVAIAAWLFAELLEGGYTQVCEFHYLHRAPDGSPYPDPATLAWALADAGAQAGIGLTLLPVLYERAGFAEPRLRTDQRRFAGDAPTVAACLRAIQGAQHPRLNGGVALHSLRAVSPAAIQALLDAIGDLPVPIHIHAAEQTREVEDCLAATGLRPLAWLCRHLPLDARWQLVHATHAMPQEIEAVARSGAGVVLCPGTEANLGDGLPDLRAWLAAGVPLAIGSDSEVSRQWPEELRWLEYGQRLALRRRNLAACPESQPSSAARLFDRVVAGGTAAAGMPRWGLQVGARADWLVLDTTASGLIGVPAEHWLDATVFATAHAPFREVYVGGEPVVRDGRHLRSAALGAAFADAMAELW